MNETIKTIMNHTSIRKFNDEPIAKDQADAIINSAMRGATAGNMMLYSIIDVRDKETLGNLAKWCDNQPFILNAKLALIFVVDIQKWDSLYKMNKIDESEGYERPSAVDLVLGMQDAMIAAQNSVIAAESMGIGTCYIGDIMENKEVITEYFDLPEYTMPATLVVFGNYDTKPQVRERFSREFVVFEDKYHTLSEAEINAMFQGKFEGDGSLQNFYRRKIGAEFYKEMVRSITGYIKKFVK